MCRRMLRNMNHDDALRAERRLSQRILMSTRFPMQDGLTASMTTLAYNGMNARVPRAPL